MEDIFGFAPTLTGTVEFLDLSDGFLGDMQSNASVAAPSAYDGGVAFMAFSAPAEEDEVVITGTRREFDPISGSPWGGVWDEPDVWTGAGEVGGGGAGEGDEDDPPCASAGEPLPEAAPVDKIRDAANQIGAAIATASIEFFAFIYVFNGEVRVSNTSSNYADNEVFPDITNSGIPRGAVVVGFIHNHPDGNRLPSTTDQDGDWNAYNNWVEMGKTNELAPWGIDVDANPLLYVVTPQGVFEYTGADIDTQDPTDGANVRDGGCG